MIDRLAWILLAVFVFTIPFEKSVWIPGVGTGTRLIGSLALSAGICVAIRRRSIRLPNLVLGLASLFAGWESLSWCWSLDAAASAARALTFVQLMSMLWLIWELCRDDVEQGQLLHAYVAGAVVASAYTIFRYATNQQTYWRRYAAAGFDPNDLGLTVALAIPIALYLARIPGGSAWFYRGAVVVMEAAVLLTASRTALIAALAGFLFAFWTWGKSTGIQRASVLALLLVLVGGTVGFAPKATRDRLGTFPAELTQGTLHNRTRIWKSGLKALKQYPFLGAGAGAYPDAVKPWLGTPAIPEHEYVAHNTFLSVLVETGLIGFVLFIGLLAAAGLFIWMLAPIERALWATISAVWLIGVSTLTWEHRKPTWLFLALMTTTWARAFWPDDSTQRRSDRVLHRKRIGLSELG